MSTVRMLHDRAMELSFHREFAQLKGEPITPEIEADSREAYRCERQAAEIIRDMYAVPESEPTRSILYRSAGWLAFKAGFYGDALEMAKEGLGGAPTPREHFNLRHLRFCAFRCDQQTSGEVAS